MRRLAILLIALTLAATGSWTQTAARSATPAAVTIPIELTPRHVIVSVRVNNSGPLAFILDTGARAAIIMLDRARELSLDLHGEVNAGGAGPERTRGSRVRGATYSLPGLPGYSGPLPLALPLSTLSTMLGRRIDGILGGAFIEQFVLELDYQALRITLHDRAKFEYSGPGESVPIEINAAGHPVVKAQVTPAGGQPIAGAFLLDIGSGGALALHSPFVAQHRLLGPHLKTVPVIGVGGAGGQVRGRFGRVAELQIGGFKFAQPIALFSEDQAGAFANASLAGNIGGLIARRFRIFLDYSRRRVILEPSAAFSEPFDRAFAGLSVAAEGADYRTFRVRQVLDDSPASEAGIRPGDVITAMDGKGASGLTLADIQQMLERPATYEVTIRRGEQVVKTTLTPKKML